MDLARIVARDLSPEIAFAVETRGGAIPATASIAGDSPAGPAQSSPGSDSAAAASFVAACSERAMAHWQRQPDEAALAQALYADVIETPSDPRLLLPADPEQRLRLIARVVKALAEQPLEISTRDFVTPTVLQPFRDMTHWIVRQDLVWEAPASAGGGWPRVVVPANFVSDLASIPSAFQGIVHPSGTHGHAAIVHDWLYWDQAIPRDISDRIFEIGMAETEVNLVLRKAIHRAVRVFGGFAWDDNAKEKAAGGKRILKELPPTSNVTWEEWRQKPGVFA